MVHCPRPDTLRSQRLGSCVAWRQSNQMLIHRWCCLVAGSKLPRRPQGHLHQIKESYEFYYYIIPTKNDLPMSGRPLYRIRSMASSQRCCSVSSSTSIDITCEWASSSSMPVIFWAFCGCRLCTLKRKKTTKLYSTIQFPPIRESHPWIDPITQILFVLLETVEIIYDRSARSAGWKAF